MGFRGLGPWGYTGLWLDRVVAFGLRGFSSQAQRASKPRVGRTGRWQGNR